MIHEIRRFKCPACKKLHEYIEGASNCCRIDTIKSYQCSSCNKEHNTEYAALHCECSLLLRTKLAKFIINYFNKYIDTTPTNAKIIKALKEYELDNKVKIKLS